MKNIIRKITSIILTITIIFTSIGMENLAEEVKAATSYITLYLEDDTPEQWLGNDNAVIEMVDNTYGHDRYIMTKETENRWSVRVPQTTYNVTFNRLSPDKSTQWNSWSAGGRDSHSTYHAITHEHGYWDGTAQLDEGFHEGDVIYLDYYEFGDWKKSGALYYVNFTNASKQDNGGLDIKIKTADKNKYSPIKLENEIEEDVYTYTVTKEDEGKKELRFWRGDADTLWNCSVTLTYSDYKEGNNCAKIQGWDDTGYVCPYVPRRHQTRIDSIELKVKGNKKINRKIEIDLDIQGETELLQQDETKITIEKETGSEAGTENILYDESKTTWQHRELIIKEPGNYHITATATDGTDTFTTDTYIAVADDKAPSAELKFNNSEENKYLRNSEGTAHIEVTDMSVSETGDEITERIYELYYDADGNGEYSEEELIERTDGNNIEKSYSLKSVGKYKIKLHVQETYTDTIPILISDSDYLAGDTEEIFEITNQAPESSMSMEKSRIADIIFTVGNADRDILEKYVSASEKVKDRLKESGIDAKVSTVSTSALTAQDTFAWTEYDHYNYADSYGQTLPKHITYEEKDIKMTGYFHAPLKDFLYIDDNDSSRKVFEFDLQRDYNNWHSMEGGGFLFNTKISEEEDYIQGYCILVTSSGLQLVQINKVSLSRFRNGTYEHVYNAGKLLQTFPMQNLYDEHHIKIVTDKNILTVYDGEKLLIDEYVLPDDGVESYGYGPVISHLSHGCSQQSYFTFKNIVMQTITGESLSDVVNNHKWTPGSNHYVINMSETSVPELSDNDRMSEVAASLIQNDVMFFGIGNNTTIDQYNTLLNSLDSKGENIELKYEDEEESSKATADEAVDSIVSTIITDINSKDYTIGYTITTDEETIYKGTYSDPENDPSGSEEWKYIYDASVFGENNEEIQEIKRDKPITMFKDAGAYEISHRVSDNPANGNPSLESYIKWSDTDEYKKLILSQNRPTAKVSAAVTQSPSDSTKCLVNVIYESEDPDHPSDLRKGIRDEKFYYKELGEVAWIEGRFPAEAAMGTTYLVKYIVTDIEGTISRPAVAAIKTSEARTYVEPEDNNPPIIDLLVSSNTVEAGETFYIETSATDDYGITDFSVCVNGENIGSTYGRYDFTAGNAGEAVITVTATDIGGNTSTETKSVTIIDKSDVTPPSINITSPGNGTISGSTDIVGSITDNKKLKSYTVKMTYTGSDGEDTEIIIANGTEEITDDIIGTIDTDGLINGVYKIGITAEDMAGLISTVTLLITVEETVSDRIPPQAEICDIVLSKDSNETVGSAVIEVTGSITDETELGGYELVMYTLGNDNDRTVVSNGTKAVINEFIGTIPAENLENGTYILELKAYDTAGNTCVSEASFEYIKGSGDSGEIERDEDITPPVIAGDLKASVLESGLNLILSGTINDENLKEYTVITGRMQDNQVILPVKIAEGTDNITESTIAEYTYESFSEGDYAVCVTAEDAAGNKRTAVYTVSITKHGTINDGYEDNENAELNLVLSGTVSETGGIIKAYMTYPENAADVSLTADGADVKVYGRSADITSDTAGEVEAVLSAVIGGETKTVSKKVRFFDKSDKVHPVAYFLSPEADSVVKAKTEIMGTAMDETGMAYYVLEYRMEGTDEYRQISYGTEPVMDGVLGELDTTVLENGRYLLRLTVVDNGGNRIRIERGINVEGNLKIGNMNIGFTDISANVSGIPLTVTRSYDSRNKSSGDFGTGWKLGMQSVRLTESSDIVEGYHMVQTGNKLSTGYFMTQTKCHDVTVMYGDGTSDRFELKLSPERQGLIPIYEVKVSFLCVTDKNVKLELNGDNSALVYGNQLLFEDDVLFDSRSYVLTKKDGTKLYLDSEHGLLKLEDTNGNTVSVSKNGFKHSDGNGVTFTRDKKGRVVEAQETGSKENVISSMTYEYDSRDNLISVTDDADRTVMFTYDDEHNLIDIIDPSGMAVARNVYDDEGRLVATIDSDGNKVEYSHDIDGKTETVRDKMGNVTVYTYDDNGNVLRTVDALGNVTESTFDENNNVVSKADAAGNVTRYDYDENNNITKKVDAYGTTANFTYNKNNMVNSVSVLDINKISINYDEQSNIKFVIDANGNETNYEYEKNGKLKCISDEIGLYHSYIYDNEGNLSELVDGNGNSIKYAYDEKGNLISKSETKTTDKGSGYMVTQYVNDKMGNVLQEISDDGSVVFYEYDINGRMTSKTDALNRSTEYSYNNLGNVEKITYADGTTDCFEYDAVGNTTKIIDRNGITSNMSYDKLGRLIKITYSNGTEETYGYDKLGNVISSVSSSGAVTIYEYDKLNRNTAVIDCYGNRTTYEYDEYSQLIKMIDAKGNAFKYEYDNNGNQTKIIYPDDTEHSFEYDARNRVILKVDAYGNKISYKYDGIGNLIGVTDALGNDTTYQYDETGNLTKTIDAKGNITKYEFNTKERSKKTTNALGKESIIKYDEVGNIIWQKDNNGDISTFTYNENNSLVNAINKDGETSYQYDNSNRLIQVKDKNGIIMYEYDSNGRIISKSMPNGAELLFTYDKFNRLSCKELKINGMERDKSTYEYDLSDRVTRVIDRNGKATVYEYDEIGNRTTVKYANGITLSYTYDACSRLMEEYVTDKDNVVLYIFKYAYGANGELKKIVETSKDNNVITEYTYDAGERLIKEIISDDEGKISNEYTYDAVGNRSTKSTSLTGNTDGLFSQDDSDSKIVTGQTNYKYNELNQLIYVENNDVKFDYEYDANGNLIKQKVSDSVKLLSYDSSNRLIGVSKSESNQTAEEERYEYDYEGNRISKITKDGKTAYVVDNSESLSRIAAEIDLSTDDIVLYHSGLELNYMESSGSTDYYIYDGHGDVRALVDINGVVTDSYRYDAFGNMLQKKGNLKNHFLYTAQYYDEFSGLYYLRARYMNPKEGSFISSDTYEGDMEEPVSLHKYLYANADPVQNYDPDGHMALLMGAAIDIEISMQQAAYDAMVFSIGMAMLHTLRNTIAKVNAASNIYYVMDMVVAGVDWLTDSAADAAAEIRAYVEEKIVAGSLVRRKDGAIYTVYTLADKEKEVKYVGRTKDFDNRMKQHRRPDGVITKYKLNPKDRYDNLTYEVCRGLEQSLMVYYHTRSWIGENGYNKINGISQKNKKGDLYYVDTISYIENQLDNELLCAEEMIYGNWWK